METAAAGWRWAAGVTGCLKGKAGDLGQLVSALGSENRGGERGRALRAGEGNEEGDGADRWARGVGGSGRERAGCASRPGREGARGAGPRRLNGWRRARAWAALAAELGRSGMRGLGRMERETAGWASSWVGFFLFFFSSSISISNSNQTI